MCGERCHVIVISPLKAFTEEQVLELNWLGIVAVMIDNEILEGKYEVVFVIHVELVAAHFVAPTVA